MPLVNKEFSVLGKDLSLWKAFAGYLKNAADMRPLTQKVEWDGLPEEDKLALLKRTARLHHTIFGTKIFPTEFYNEEQKHYAPGFHGILAYEIKRPEKKVIVYDGDVAIPRTGHSTEVSTLFYALAQQLLFTRASDHLNDAKEPVIPEQISDIIKYQSMLLDGGDEDTQYFDVMTDYPMPDQFDRWMDIPSHRYALDALTLMSREVLGTDEIDPELLVLVRKHFLQDQASYLSTALDEDNRILDKGDLYRERWEQRAICYIEHAFREPEMFNLKRAAELISHLRINCSYTIPPHIKDALAQDVDLEILSYTGRQEALAFWSLNALSELTEQPDLTKTLKPETRLTLLGKLGPQKEIPEEEREACDYVAANLLRKWPLQESYLAYYEALFQEMAKELRQNDKLNELGELWQPSEHPRRNSKHNFVFLMALNEAVSNYMGIKSRPILAFRKERIVDPKPWQKDAGAFATYGGCSAKELRRHYNLRNAPEDTPFIAINTHPEIGLFTQETPMRASRIIIHEIFHHEVDDRKAEFHKGLIPKDDPRYAQIAEFRLVDDFAQVDHLLRGDFSEAVYPLIQTEKFQYWVMDAFERSQPFGFLKS